MKGICKIYENHADQLFEGFVSSDSSDSDEDEVPDRVSADKLDQIGGKSVCRWSVGTLKFELHKIATHPSNENVRRAL